MNESEIRKQLIDAREEYIKIIKSELLGPGSEFSLPDIEHELISSTPTSRYSVGILFPQGNQMNQDNDETVPLPEADGSTDKEESDAEAEIQTEPVQESRKHVSEFDETADENLDEEIGMSMQYMPSSMGITFLIKGNADIIKGKVTFATYRKALITDCAIPYTPADPEHYAVPSELAHKMSFDKNTGTMKLLTQIKAKEVRDIFEKDTIPENEYQILKQIAYRFVDYCNAGYVRVPHEISEFILDFSKGEYVDAESNRELDGTSAKIVALRTKVSDDIWSVTVMLVNELEEVPAKANHCIFQSRIEINTHNNCFSFVESNPNPDIHLMDEEECSLELLYRHKKIYGTGLGTSVDWDIDEQGKGSVWNDFFPIEEIPAMNFSLPKNRVITNNELSMKYLSDLNSIDKDTKISSMYSLVDLYKSWVVDLEKTASLLDTKYISAASKNIAECRRAYERMYAGIKTLKENETAYKAFLLANRAMFMQRVHITMQSDMAKKSADRYPEDEEISDWLRNMDYYKEDDASCRWRPFQIAFLLMDINSIVYDESPERNIVDLIWFPTGGGKTEAYLGLTAFAIFYRRLTHSKEAAGTTVIMRYTLRLLAAQQFTRAATLICACEYIRQQCEKKHRKYPIYSLGKEPISIGLWIGGTHIPNRNEGKNSASYHLEKLKNVSKHYYVRSEKERHNKFQVLKCPWCGTKMVKDDRNNKLVGEWGYNMGSGKHFYMFCPQEDCDFTNKLPIQIIDDELYRNPPTLLFGTVDKFAMMPWDGRIGAFFGIGSNNRAPELIIQDELHLISGALGTVVGIYETAVDGICGQKGVYPKIIASTATIRRAKEQCSVLYNREVVQFPAPGLDAEDSFFARESTIDYEKGIYGRKYIGIMPSGKTKAMTEIRMMAALMQKAYTMDLPDEIKDKFWTLTVYFNSLKDLGKASTLVDDDVKDFIIRTANRMFTTRRLIVRADELTSRVSTTELNETLDKLEKIEYSKENMEAKQYASSVLLATNMISVGIDVARLNVMLMVGQPKLTSEYIQASSRVGRSFPGLCFIQYDATKSRDRSHYERFRSYHESFYRFVEPTGATPFSKPARERALHAVLTAMIRQKEEWKDDKDAQKFDMGDLEKSISEIQEFVLNRIKSINARSENQLKDDIEDVRSEMQEFFEKWQELVEECNQDGGKIPIYFGRRFMVSPPNSEERRLLRQYNSAGRDAAVDTLTSMRNVDAPVTGSVVIWEE
ncbi:helicase-related protein [Bacteroides acidifaciens]|uniref:helicase-related protein n=2 Tax=Bacteroides acidifaciens TaxID=85831 RepID=UPI0026EED25E|nr:helicase-related protein [Bacteroides acidifaciens]